MGEPPATSAHTSFPWATGSVCAARGHQRLRTRRPIPNLDSFRLSHACSCCPLRPAARVYRSPRARPAAQATPKTPACKGPPPRGAPQVLRGRRCRSRSLRAPPRCSSQNLPETSPACAAAILRLSGARWRRGSTSPSRPDAYSPCPEPSTPSFARPRHSRASREVDVRLTCVAIVSCDHVVSVV